MDGEGGYSGFGTVGARRAEWSRARLGHIKLGQLVRSSVNFSASNVVVVWETS